MTIKNLLFLVEGELKNSPAISNIEGFSNNLEKIKRGDLFFAKDKNDIYEAVQKGAYAILFDGWTQIIDSEVAWIKVENLELAALKLLRFFLIQNSIPLYSISPLEWDMIKTITNKDEILYIDSDFTDAIVNIYKKDIKFAVIKNKDLKKKLSLDINYLKISNKIDIKNRYLFETSFVYNGIFYERINLPIIFIDDFNIVLNLLDSYKIEYHLKNIEKLNHFKPYFIDNNFTIKEFGKSEKVIILENSYELLDIERNYLEKHAAWAKKIYICDEKKDFFIYEKEFDKIKEILYNANFNFALIAAKNMDVEKLQIRKKVSKLF